jgi:integrase
MHNLAQHEPQSTVDGRTIVLPEANTGSPLKGDFERMARRRFQDPKPFKRGAWWCLLYWQDEFVGGNLKRVRKWAKLAPATMGEREVRKIAAETLRPMNQGLESRGSATPFGSYVESTYKPTVLPLLASTTQDSYEGILRKHLMPAFENTPLRDMTVLTLQQFFSGLGKSALGGETVLKIKEVLSSVLGSGVRYDVLTKNPMLAVEIPRSKIVNRKKAKPYLTPEEFDRLLELVAEPYATMIYVAVYSALRVSELVGLKWDDVHDDSLTVDERYCRGDWSITKTIGSAATVGVDASVIARIRRLKTVEVEINWGGKGAKKRFKAVRADGLQDLVFASLRKGTPMCEGNILRRHLKPAASALKIDPKKVTWRALRRSYGTWMVEAGADPKSVQGQMRHARISTTMDIYAQHVPESQRRAVVKMMDWTKARQAEARQLGSASIN